MWNRKCKLISSSEKDRICFQRKVPNNKMTGNKPLNIQESVAVGTSNSKHAAKKTALAQLSAMYATSSGESSSELSDDNGDADGKSPTKTCSGSRSEISDKTKEKEDQSKHEDHCKQKVKDVEPQKSHGFSLGELLSQLRSEDAAKENKSKKCTSKRKARTDAGVPSREQGPCRKLQFRQHGAGNTSKVLDDTQLLTAKKNGCGKRNEGANSKAEVAVPKERSITGCNKNCCGQSKPNEGGIGVVERKGGSSPFLKHMDNNWKSLVTSVDNEGVTMTKGCNPLLFTRAKEVVPSSLEDSSSWHLVGELVSRQVEQIRHKDIEKHVGKDIEPGPTHPGVLPLSPPGIKDKERNTKNQLASKKHMDIKDVSENKSSKEADDSKSEHRSCFNGVESLEWQHGIFDTRFQHDQEQINQEEGRSNLGDTRNESITNIVHNKQTPSDCIQKQHFTQVPHRPKHSEVVGMDLHTRAMKNKVAKEHTVSENLNMGHRSRHFDIEKGEIGSILPEEVQHEGARRIFRTMTNHSKATEKVQDLIEDSEKRRNGYEAVTAQKANQLLEMQDETHRENYTIIDDSKKTRLVRHTCRSDGLPLQHKHFIVDGGRKTHLQCKRDKEDIKCPQGSWNGALETTMSSHFSSSPFPESTEDTSELPMAYWGKRAEMSGGDGAHESTEWNDAALDSNIGFIALSTECHAENVLYPISPEKSQGLCIQEEDDNSCLKPNFDQEQKERPLHETSCDFKNCDFKLSYRPALERNQEGDVLVDKGMCDGRTVKENDGNSFDVKPPLLVHSVAEEKSTTETIALAGETSVIDQSRQIVSRKGKGHIQTGDAMDVSQGSVTKSNDDRKKDILEVWDTSDRDLAEKRKDNHVQLDVCDTLSQDLAAVFSDHVDELNNLSRVHSASPSELSSTDYFNHSSVDSCDIMREQPILESNDKADDDCGTDTAAADRGDFSVSSIGSGAVGEVVTGLVCQESDQSMDGSLAGLSDALDREFSSKSRSPTLMKNLNMRLRLESNVITTENIDTSSLMDNCDHGEQEFTKHPNCSVDEGVSRSASPFEGGDESADKPISDHIQDMLLNFKEREALGEDFNLPPTQFHRESGEGPVTERSDDALTEFDTLISHEPDLDLEEGTVKETYLELDKVSEQDFGALTIELQEEPLSTSSHLAEELNDRDDVLSLVCDMEDLMSSLDDLLQDESLQLNKKSPTPDESISVGDISSTSTSTKDSSTTNPPQPSRLSPGEQSPKRSRVFTRGGDRPSWDSKQGCKISIHSRNGNSRFVCKNQDSHRAVLERSPKRVAGPNRNWSAYKPLSASERLALHQRLGAQNAANASPNLALQQLMRNGPAIQQSGILQHQLQQQHQHQQQIQRHLQRQLPPALHFRLGLVKHTGQQCLPFHTNKPLQCTPHDVALIVQRQQLMIEKIIQLYQKERESDVVIEKQKQIIRHYQQAFLIAKKGGPLSMQDMHDGGNLRPCYSPRPRSTSPSADLDPERQIGRKWSLPSDPRDEQRYVEDQEAKRMKLFPGNLYVDKPSGDRSSGYPDAGQPQRHVEGRTETSRRNPDKSGSGAGCNIPQDRQRGYDNLGNPRLQREERMVITVPSYRPEDERHREIRCILQRSTPIVAGTRNYPHRNNADEVFQPIRESHDEQLRVCPPRAPFLKSDVPRQTSPATVVEQYEEFRSPHMVQRGVPHHRPHSPPGYACQQDRVSPVMASQGRRAPSPFHPNWESCRITERGTGMMVDYCHTSIHPKVERADMQQEPPPFNGPDRQRCSSPLYQRPPDSRSLSPDEASRSLFRAPVSLNRLLSQDTFQAPMGPSRANNQTVCRAPMRPSVVYQGIHRGPMHLSVADSQGIHRACMRPSVLDSQAVQRAHLRPSVVDSQGIHRESFLPSVVDSQGIHRESFQPSVADSQSIHRAPMRPSVVDSQAIRRPSFHPSVVSISHHWTAKNFQGMPRALPRLPHPPGGGLLESQMRPQMEYQQDPGYPARNRVRQFHEDRGPGFESEWNNECPGYNRRSMEK